MLSHGGGSYLVGGESMIMKKKIPNFAPPIPEENNIFIAKDK